MNKEQVSEQLVLDSILIENINILLDNLPYIKGHETNLYKEVFEYKYGLNGKKSLNFTEISQIVNLSKSRIEQIHKHGLRLLRNPKRQVLIKDFLN